MSEHICLIVDDEPEIRAYVRAILARDQFQSLEAENASQALRIVHRLGGRLDFIVTDIKMPGDIDGLDLAYSVRNSFPGVGVVLITGYAYRINDTTFELVLKPFLAESLLNVIRKATDSRR